jgi:hypothetical protein
MSPTQESWKSLTCSACAEHTENYNLFTDIFTLLQQFPETSLGPAAEGVGEHKTRQSLGLESTSGLAESLLGEAPLYLNPQTPPGLLRMGDLERGGSCQGSSGRTRTTGKGGGRKECRDMRTLVGSQRVLRRAGELLMQVGAGWWAWTVESPWGIVTSLSRSPESSQGGMMSSCPGATLPCPASGPAQMHLPQAVAKSSFHSEEPLPGPPHSPTLEMETMHLP